MKLWPVATVLVLNQICFISSVYIFLNLRCSSWTLHISTTLQSRDHFVSIATPHIWIAQAPPSTFTILFSLYIQNSTCLPVNVSQFQLFPDVNFTQFPPWWQRARVSLENWTLGQRKNNLNNLKLPLLNTPLKTPRSPSTWNTKTKMILFRKVYGIRRKAFWAGSLTLQYLLLAGREPTS